MLREDLARIYAVRHVFLFRSARQALWMLFRALGENGVVGMPAYNCIAVPEAIIGAGWRPLFVDIAKGDVNMTVDTLKESLPKEANAVILTHQFGVPATVDPILDFCRERGLVVVEDAAAAVGARYKGRLVGCFGDAAVLSFHLTKVINVGRLGVLLTNEDVIAKKIVALQGDGAEAASNVVDFLRALVWWTATRQPCYEVLRDLRTLLKSDRLYETIAPVEFADNKTLEKPSCFVASLANRQLNRLFENVSDRQALASFYANRLAGLPGIQLLSVPSVSDPAWIQYPVFVEEKECCYRFFLQRGVDLSWTFRYSCGASYGIKNAPNSERAARTVLGLPTYPGFPIAEASRICGLMRQFLKR